MKQGYDKIPIRTVDTDVVVLAVTSAQRLNITELWINNELNMQIVLKVI